MFGLHASSFALFRMLRMLVEGMLGLLGCRRAEKVRCKDYGFASNKFSRTCMKHIKRGIPMVGSCGDDKVMGMGLCYPKCRKDFEGVGPTCWQRPPIVEGVQWTKCGMGAALTKSDCAFVIGDQIASPLMTLLNIVSFGFSGSALKSTFTAVKGAAKGVIGAAKLAKTLYHVNEKDKKTRREAWKDLAVVCTSLNDVASKGSNEIGTVLDKSHADCVDNASTPEARQACATLMTAKETLLSVAGDTFKEGCNKVPSTEIEHSSDESEEAEIQKGIFTGVHPVERVRATIGAIGLVDPTGIADSIAAFTYPLCTVFADEPQSGVQSIPASNTTTASDRKNGSNGSGKKKAAAKNDGIATEFLKRKRKKVSAKHDTSP